MQKRFHCKRLKNSTGDLAQNDTRQVVLPDVLFSAKFGYFLI